MGYNDRVTLWQLLRSKQSIIGSMIAVALAICLCAAFAWSIHSDNNAYRDQQEVRATLTELEPAERQIYAEGMLRTAEFVSDDAAFGDKMEAMLQHVAKTGEIPPQNSRLHSNSEFWDGWVYVVQIVVYFVVSLALLLALGFETGYYDGQRMVTILPWQRVWPVFYVTFLAANPIAFITLVISALRALRDRKKRRKQTKPNTILAHEPS